MIFYCDMDAPVVATDKGKLRGYLFNDIYQFKGIPYAKAKRFGAPEETEAFDGIKDMFHYGNVCPLMFPDSAEGDILSPHRVWFQNEDCLNLNIWTPSLKKGEDLPVVVWLHGGGFFSGSSIEQYAYDGENMSRKGNVVVVTVNHRLNVLGYLDLRGFGEKYERSCNAGNLDLIAALKWIHKNISGFGGNPENVTIFGQSGGGGKVITLMQMPEADGLFHKALIMSGILGEILSDKNRDTKPVISKTMENLGIKEVDELETVPYPELVKAYLSAYRELVSEKGIPFFGPIQNRDYYGDPMKVGFTENAKKIPVMIGSVYAEFFHSKYKDEKVPDDKMEEVIKKQFGNDAGDRLIQAFRKAYPEKMLCDIYAADSSAFRYETKKWVAKSADERYADTYSYLFALEFPFNGGTPAWHCSDIPFFFHNIEKVPVVNVEGVSERLCGQIFEAFMSFVHTGIPSSKLLPEWKKCSKTDEVTMIFDKECEVRHNFDTEFIQQHYDMKVSPLSL